ncbi:hypothetical protein M2171_000375 [Bradyrhizobium japonicum USDA 38]|nr:hypothetical protein [Bradyrhizobium japonicum USDA 38]MCS3943758.1 hypothetical protein [Bradyrhizobium japonicum]MCW2223545.1 hypothetical protein [Bradyrhizobium japonicum]MCW2348157.1 hypothetical protein [Bradyrhizobium japonicum]
MAARKASPSRRRAQGPRDEDVVAKRHTGQTDRMPPPTKQK